MLRQITHCFVIICLAAAASFSQGYYPLHVGNRWDYGELISAGHFDFMYSVRIVGDTVMPNGNTYAVRTFPWQVDYLRQSGDTVFRYTDQGDAILYDFSLENGDTVSVRYEPGDTIVTTVTIGQGTVFNIVRKQWTYTIRPRHSTAEGWFTISDSVGYSYGFGEPGWSEYLIGAIIGGRQYGVINDVQVHPAGGPSDFRLYQNYPNPFNPGTTIRYFLPHRSHVTLSVFNTLGQQVARLVDGEEEAGYHEVKFDARLSGGQARQTGGRGSSLVSGVYFYRLETPGFVQTRKTLLVR